MSNSQITRPLINKKGDQFYIKFFRLPENYANILGRQVKSMERPVVNFETHDIFNKGVKNTSTDKIAFDSVSVTFADDDAALVNKVLYEQIRRQNGLAVSAYTDSISFEIVVETYDAKDVLVEKITLQECFIRNVTHSEAIAASSEDNIITAEIIFNGLCYDFPVLDA